MIFDCIVIVIVVLAAITGYRKGFVYSIIHLAGWAGSLFGGIMLTPLLKPIVQQYTGYYSWLQDGFAYRFKSMDDGITATTNSLPTFIRDDVQNTASDLTSSISSSFTDIIFTITVFLAIVLVIKLIAWLLLRVAAKNYREHTGGVDGFFGLLLGLVRGLLYVWIFLALLVPAVNLASPDFTTAVTDSLNNSYIAGFLYDNNGLLLLLQFLIS